MAETDQLPTPQPVASTTDLPAPQPVETAQNLPAPIPVSSATPQTSELPAPVDPSAQPVSQNDHSLLSSFRDQIEKPAAAMLTGAGTTLGSGEIPKMLANPMAGGSFERSRDAFKKFVDTSLIVPKNAITPEEATAHPRIAAVENGVSSVVKSLTTPGSLALILGTEGLGEIPAFLEKTLAGTESLAPYAPKAAKVAQKALQGLGAYFTASQLADAVQAVPEIAQAIMTGQTDKAIELTTAAFINGAVGTHAGLETRRSLRASADAAAETSAMKHKEYADIVHERQKTLQVAGGQKNQIADLGREVAPNLKDREWTTDYVEANKDRALLAERQAETKVGPKPADQIAAASEAQGKEVPLEAEPKPVEKASINPNAVVDPKVQKVVEDAGGVYRGQNKDGLVEITLPREMTSALPIHDKLKEFVSVTLPAEDITPEAVKSAMDAKFKLMGGKIPESEIPATQEEISNPASQHALSLKAAIEDAKASSAKHVITPEERAKMVEQQDPNKTISLKHEKAIDTVRRYMDMIKKQAQDRGLLPKGQLRDNFVPHEYDFDDTSDPTRRRLYDTYHDAQQAGLVGKNKDYFALTSDYLGKMWNRFADSDTIRDLKNRRTNDGAPLAVPGGFVEGQRVSAEGPQSYTIDQKEVQKYTKNGKLPGMIKSGRVSVDPTGKVFTMKADDYVKAANLYETRPIGPTPIPPKVLKELQPHLEDLEKKGLIFHDTKGNYFNTESLYARVPVYLHPDIADHFNDAVKPKTEEPTSFFGRAGKLYDDTTGNMKSLLLSWSPFHRVTESARMMESLGILKGGKLAAQTNLGMAPKVDYFNLTPTQESAIRDGIVTADPRGGSMSNVEEGLSAGEGKTWGAKTYRLFDQGLEKLGVPENIRNKVNLQKILTDDVFGPQGMITHAKFAFYEARKPTIAAQIAKDHPDWPNYEVDKHAGRLTAKFANNKFGGLNTVVLGRTLQDQKWLRRVLLAPDFLESTGRSVLDLGNKYGGELAAKLIQFNIAHALTAAGINYFLHHKDGDTSIKGAVDATHILDHPYGVVSHDNKTVYGLRTTATDFLHMINKPREFAYDRVNPMLRATDETIEQRNQYGRKESLPEALKAFPKAALPIQVQNAVGLGPNTTTEPSAGDQFLKSIGIQARPNRSNAEQMAIDKVSAKLQGQEARTGGALVHQQLKFNAEDKLRSAYQMQDPDKKAKALEDAKHDIENLTQRKIINPDEKKKILTDAKGSRLKSIFNSLTPDDALDVWNAATDDEKKELGVAMNSKYYRWREKLAKDGQNISKLNIDDQKTLDEFKAAATQLAEIRERPEPAPAPKPAKAAERKEANPISNELPEPEPYTAELPAPTPYEAPKTSDYAPLIQSASAKYGVDPKLMEAMVHQESLGDPNAVSRKGAKGLLQLEPLTAQHYGVTDINDPEQNIDAGTHYMADLLKLYDGDEAKALAAFNAGPTAVHKYNGVPPFPETKHYVSAIQNR